MLKFLSSDKITLQEAEEREKELKDVNSMLYDQLLELAKKQLHKFSDEEIADMYDLELFDVQQIRVEMEW